ncbi:MAG TPA: hypothetical protein VGZ47_02995 [Gemmataceae bacterium]|nr:hypothetical protein [Gemmataceae bacterium]
MSAPRSSPRTDRSVLWLVGGLFLGIMLVLAGVALIELAIGHGLLGSDRNGKKLLAETQRLQDQLSEQQEKVRRLERANPSSNEMRNRLDQAQRNLDRDRAELEELHARVKKQERLLEKADEIIRDVEQKLAAAREKNGEAKEDRSDTPSDVEEGVAENMVKKARKLMEEDKDAAIKLLMKVIDEHPKTRAAKEAKKLLEDLKKD